MNQSVIAHLDCTVSKKQAPKYIFTLKSNSKLQVLLIFFSLSDSLDFLPLKIILVTNNISLMQYN